MLSKSFQNIDLPSLNGKRPRSTSITMWELDRHYYSVPYELLKEEVHLRFSDTTVEIFHQHQRVASHRRDKRAGRHSTLKEHMPKSHQKYLEWSPSRMIQWASTLGPRTANFIECLLAAKQYPEQGYRSCSGIMRLAKCYPKERLGGRLRACRPFGQLPLWKRGIDPKERFGYPPNRIFKINGNVPPEHPGGTILP